MSLLVQKGCQWVTGEQGRERASSGEWASAQLICQHEGRLGPNHVEGEPPALMLQLPARSHAML